jgi:hypothetical protein
MDKATTPLVVSVLFVARCLIPLLFLFGLSYLLKRLGLIQDAPESPNGNSQELHNESGEGGLANNDV